MSEDEPARAFELAAADFAALAPRLWDRLGRILWCSTRRRAPASGSWTPAAVPAHRPSPPRRRWGPRAGLVPVAFTASQAAKAAWVTEQVTAEKGERPDLTEAQIVVSGGRGTGSA